LLECVHECGLPESKGGNMARQSLDRRAFLRLVGAAGVAAATGVGAVGCRSGDRASGTQRLPRRELGSLGIKLSVVGFGGIVVMNEPQEQADALVTQAIERGINYFDVAPSYGNAEERLGPALEPYRDQVFLACKTEQRTRQAAWDELQRSLERLRTDHFDLYQFHAVTTMAEVEQICGAGGAMEAFEEARDAGLIRYIGFSAHDEAAAVAMMDRLELDSILYPLQWACWYRGGFGKRVLPMARERGMGILALKALARGPKTATSGHRYPKCWYEPMMTAEEAALGLRWTLALEGVTAAVSPSHAELLWWACDAAEDLRPPTEEEVALLEEEARRVTPLFTAS